MRTGVHPQLYNCWMNMKQRCDNPNRRDYAHWGGRGITYCEEWRDYDAFLRDMGPTWFRGARIDRIDNSKGYAPSNCRWVDSFVSAQNRDYVKLTKTLADEIRALYRLGDTTQRKLGKKFGLSKSHIGNVLAGRCWR